MSLAAAKGQTSVLLIIILPAAILLAGVLVDMARIATGETHVKRAAASAARSLLAEYHTRLKDEYGIFALSGDSPEKLSQTAREYIEKNLMADGSRVNGKYLDLYQLKVENVTVTPVFNLTENEVMERQILEYMKYRAPKEIIGGIWERLSQAGESGKMSEAYRKKMEADKLLAKLDKYQQRLKKCISGAGAGSGCCVNGFNREGSRDKTADDIASLRISYDSLLEELSDIESEIDAARNYSGSEDSVELEALKNRKSQISGQISETRQRLKTRWDELYRRETRDFEEPNKEALQIISEMKALGEKAEAAINDLDEYTRANFKSGSEVSGTFKNELEGDIRKLRSLVLDTRNTQEITGAFSGNIRALEEMAVRLDNSEKDILKTGRAAMQRDEIVWLLTKEQDKYDNSIEYDYARPDKASSMKDPRDGIAESVKSGLDRADEEAADIEESGIDMEQLPSRRKVPSAGFDSPDDVASGKTEEENENVSDAKAGAAYQGDLANVDREMDFKNEDEGFTGKAFGFITALGDIIPDGLASVRDEIYINEYIMGVFKNSVPALKKDDSRIPDLDLRSLDKVGRDTFFRSEVEYILHGNSSEKLNRLMTESEVLLVRFALNTLHVYTDAKKKELASAIAAAVSGWWTGGAGIPLISNLIMCGWGMGEAVSDLKELMDGKTVPFYKLPGDWKLDMGIGGGGKKSDSRLHFSYYDYLRLFLLTKSRKEKLGRIEDLIELNLRKAKSGFRMGTANTYVRVEAEVSMRYFFITGSFIPMSRKTPEGRHRYRVVVYEGF